jgi:hypothetical protein
MMYLGTLLCALICVVVVFQVAVTYDTSLEWIIWIFVILGFFLLGFGYIYEGRYKKEHPEEFMPPNSP